MDSAVIALVTVYAIGAVSGYALRHAISIHRRMKYRRWRILLPRKFRYGHA